MIPIPPTSPLGCAEAPARARPARRGVSILLYAAAAWVVLGLALYGLTTVLHQVAVVIGGGV